MAGIGEISGVLLQFCSNSSAGIYVSGYLANVAKRRRNGWILGKIYVTRECIARGELQIYYCFCWKSESRIGTILIFRFKIQS